MSAVAIVLLEPKYAFNVGAVVRLASAYGVRNVVYTGDRVALDIESLSRLPREERMKGYKDVSFVRDDRPLDRFLGATPVAIEVRKGSEPLHTFIHPKHAVYVFGPEDGSIGGGIAAKCHRFVVIPTRHCLNLATAVATIMWDRYVKSEDGPFVTPGEWEERGHVAE